jgi:hypothetical protein
MTQHPKYKPGQRLIIISPLNPASCIQHAFRPLTAVIVLGDGVDAASYMVYSRKLDLKQEVSACCLMEDTPENRIVALL